MAPCEITEDYYFILEISQFADSTSIKTSYRRLAKTRHPDKNPTNPNATVEFQLLQAAYSTLSDPESRRSYDIRYPSIMRIPKPRPGPTAQSTRHQQPNSTTSKTENENKFLRLNHVRNSKESELLKEKRELDKIRRELEILQEEIARADREKAAKGGWLTYMASFVVANARENEEERSESERRQLDRKAAQTIKGKMRERQDSKVQALEMGIRHLDDEIRKVLAAIQKLKDEEEHARLRAAQKRAAQATEERRGVEEERVRQEREAFMKQAEAERRRSEAAKAEQERRGREAESERAEREKIRRREQFERSERERIRRVSELRRAKQARDAAAAEKKDRKQAETRTKGSGPSANGFTNTSYTFSPASFSAAACEHGGFWPQVEGPHRCAECSITTTRFAFECPGCKKVACASCRRVLKGESSMPQAQQYGTRTSWKRGSGNNSRPAMGSSR